MKLHRLLSPIAACCLLMSPAFSQPGPGMMGQGQQRLEQLKKIRLMEALKLDEETSIRFFARYGEHQDAVREIVKKRSDVIDKLYGNMKDDGDDVDYSKFIDETLAMERDIIDARAGFLKGLNDILSKRQIAQYVVFERRFNQDVREMMREMNQRRRRF